MGLFDSVLQKAGNLGSGLSSAATQFGSEVVATSKNSAARTALEMELKAIEADLNKAYANIGRKYVEYIITSGDMPGIDIRDYLSVLEPKLDRKKAIEIELADLEMTQRNEYIMKEKIEWEKECMGKLDKALRMGIIDKDEYDKRVQEQMAKSKNFEAIRKVEMQAELGLISEAEKQSKLAELM